MRCTQRTQAVSTCKRPHLSSERCQHVKFPLKTIENTGFQRNDSIRNRPLLIMRFRRNRFVYICLNSTPIVFQLLLTGLNSVRYFCIRQIPDRKSSISKFKSKWISKRPWTITTQSCDKKSLVKYIQGVQVIYSWTHHYYRPSSDR